MDRLAAANVLLPNTYTLDSATGVLARSNAVPSAPPSRRAPPPGLADFLAQTGDVGVGSDALGAFITDWASCYHLSPQRADLLRPLRHVLGGRILELGAGCGALTRYLGEIAQLVLAVEMDAEQAAIARLRCRELDQVTVVSDRWAQLELTGPVDVVTVIGLPLADDGQPHPLPRLLRRAGHWLTPDGALILAVDNQFGLKYLAGSPDEDSGLPFQGINDAYHAQSLHPLGRHALTEALADAGFAHTTWLYPFPDYKLPSVVISQAGAEVRSAMVANLLAMGAPDQEGAYVRLFSEELAWPALLKNNLLADLANSFLVVARRAPPTAGTTPCVDPGALAYIYSTANRSRNFAKETVIRYRPDDAPHTLVERRRLYAHLPMRRGEITQVLVDEAAHEGRLYIEKLSRVVNRAGWSLGDVAAWAQPWIDLLRSHAVHHDDELDFQVGGHLVDCVPFNLIVTPEGTLQPFDLEWQLAAPIPARWVLLRGLFYALTRLRSVASPAVQMPSTILDISRATLDQLGWGISEQDVEYFLRREAECFGFPPEPKRQLRIYVRPLVLREEIDHRAQQLRAYEGQAHNWRQQALDAQNAAYALRLEVAALKNRLGRECARATEVVRRPPWPPRRWAGAARRMFGKAGKADTGDQWLEMAVDANYYLNRYTDVADSGMDPVRHYLDHGAQEGRNPNDWFDTRYYLATNPDVVSSGVNPLVHYLLVGWRQGRSVTPTAID